MKGYGILFWAVVAVIIIRMSIITHLDDGAPCVFIATHWARHGVALCGW